MVNFDILHKDQLMPLFVRKFGQIIDQPIQGITTILNADIMRIIWPLARRNHKVENNSCISSCAR